jgi:hypothetical protein
LKETAIDVRNDASFFKLNPWPAKVCLSCLLKFDMKRIAVLAAAISLVLGLAVLIGPSRKIDPEAPRFVPGQVSPVGPFTSNHYGWAELVPFASGKVWLWTTSNRTNHHCFLYDLDKRLVVGELFNAGPIFCNDNGTKLLCEGHASLETSLKQKLIALSDKNFRGKGPLAKVNRADTYWVLDLRDNSVRRLGELSQFPGTGSCNLPSNAEEASAFFLCDLETGVFEKIKFQGDVQGWWDESQSLVRDSEQNFMLFDVTTRKTNTLFSARFLEDSIRQMNLTNYSGQIRAINNWNGHGYDVYFAMQTAS